jgi:hypothetical protein
MLFGFIVPDRAFFIGRYNSRVHIVFLADGTGIAQLFGHGVQYAHDFALAVAVAGEFANIVEGAQCIQAACPRTEILGGKVFPAYSFDILIHVTRTNGMALSIIIIVLEKLIPGNVLAFLYQVGNAAALQLDIIL